MSAYFPVPAVAALLRRVRINRRFWREFERVTWSLAVPPLPSSGWTKAWWRSAWPIPYTPDTVWRKVRNGAYTRMEGRRDLLHRS